MSALTPYDTGKRAEPKLWVTSTAGVGATNNPDDWGKVDFTTEEDGIIATAYIEQREDGSYVMVLEEFISDLDVEGPQ